MSAELTVGLPLYRAEKIAWICLESLCRQKAAPPWELVVCEESEQAVGRDGIMAYESRLKDAGCVRIEYRELDKWIPLGAKWAILAQMAGDTGMFCLTAADCYSPHGRLALTAKMGKDGADWCCGAGHVLYDLQSGRRVFYRTAPDPRGSSMALRTDLAKTLPLDSDRWRSVDRYVFETVVARNRWHQNVLIEDTIWREELNVHGLNNISDRRGTWASPPPPPYIEDARPLESFIPAEIISRLEALRDEVKTWQRVDQIKPLKGVSVGRAVEGNDGN